MPPTGGQGWQSVHSAHTAHFWPWRLTAGFVPVSIGAFAIYICTGSLRGASMMSVRKVAEYFLAKADDSVGDGISNLKLQKLVYYAQGYHLALHGGPLFG